jgi:hydroxymethylpyrimidine pyrophosphatase-like HAD family hydrolase/adenine/guanine phosphoribosyltransferase-like PRPP-binding protein
LKNPPLEAAPSLRLPNLLNDCSTLAELLVGQLEAQAWLDAFLLAAGVNQILDDALHQDPLALNRLSARLPASLARWVRPAARAVSSLHGRAAALSETRRCRDASAALASDLADLVMAKGGDNGRVDVARARELARRVRQLPAGVRRDPVRLPSGFLNHDQHPADVRRLIALVIERWPERRRPVLVMGIRTSGSYLAPLAASCLRSAGQRDVMWMTMRPGRGWLPYERSVLRRMLNQGALVLVIDDPPNTGSTLKAGAESMSAFGFPPESVAVLMQPYPSTVLGSWVDRYPIVRLPWDQWHIQDLLQPEAIKASLTRLLGDEAAIVWVRPHPGQSRHSPRGHLAALYDIELTIDGRESEQRLVYAKGVGLGYLGAHALAVSEPLRRFLPTLYGLSDGLLIREWLPESDRLDPSLSLTEPMQELVAYVHERAVALPVAEDTTRLLKNRLSLRRWVGRFLAQPFGRMQFLVWPLTEAIAQQLLLVSRPSVVDGATDIKSWFYNPQSREGGRLRKIGFADHAFSGLDMFCYDPVFDLAGIAAGSDSPAFEAALRTLYSELGHERIDPERWLIYQLVHLLGYAWTWNLSDPELERRLSRRFQSYFADLWLADLPPDGASGGLCAIDLDGVLEATPLGVSSLSIESARALRALSRHGYRPVIASGRSVEEVRDRCLAYRLPGGVAEYGAAVYVTEGDRVRTLLTDAELEVLAGLRSRLVDHGLRIDPAYRLAVRAFRIDESGSRRGLRHEQIVGVLSLPGLDRIRAIEGEAQTDFMVSRVDKGTGMAALGEELGEPRVRGSWLSLAVGDTASDLPLLRQAQLPFAPANADAVVRNGGIRVSRRFCQAGFEEAVSRLIGHRPGRCERCREPHLDPRSRMLLTVLSSAHPDGSNAAKAVWAMTAATRMLATLARVMLASRASRLDTRAPQTDKLPSAAEVA